MIHRDPPSVSILASTWRSARKKTSQPTSLPNSSGLEAHTRTALKAFRYGVSPSYALLDLTLGAGCTECSPRCRSPPNCPASMQGRLTFSPSHCTSRSLAPSHLIPINTAFCAEPLRDSRTTGCTSATVTTVASKPPCG